MIKTDRCGNEHNQKAYRISPIMKEGTLREKHISI